MLKYPFPLEKQKWDLQTSRELEKNRNEEKLAMPTKSRKEEKINAW